jgi:hypothetical protein
MDGFNHENHERDFYMAKRTPPNKPKPEVCEVPDCGKPPTCVLGGFWFCAEHGNRDYEKSKSQSPFG